MINKTDDYIEAKRIIKNSVNDDYEKAFMKSTKRRAIFLSSLVAGFGTTIGIATGSALAAIGVIPFATFGIICSLMPIFLHKKNNEKIENGEFFKGKSHQEVIDIANRYVDTYNEFEQGKTR